MRFEAGRVGGMKNLDIKSLVIGALLVPSVLLLTSATRQPTPEPDPVSNALLEALVEAQTIQAEAWATLAENGLSAQSIDVPSTIHLLLGNSEKDVSTRPLDIEVVR